MSHVATTRGPTRYGQYGAAGIIIHRYRHTGEVELLLGRRGESTDSPGVWSTIGGALNEGETTHEAASREMREEVGFTCTNDNMLLTATSVDDYGNWSYTTICLTPKKQIELSEFKTTKETPEVAWLSREQLSMYPLHPGFIEGVLGNLHFLLPPDVNPQTGDIKEPAAIK